MQQCRRHGNKDFAAHAGRPDCPQINQCICNLKFLYTPIGMAAVLSKWSPLITGSVTWSLTGSLICCLPKLKEKLRDKKRKLNLLIEAWSCDISPQGKKKKPHKTFSWKEPFKRAQDKKANKTEQCNNDISSLKAPSSRHSDVIPSCKSGSICIL